MTSTSTYGFNPAASSLMLVAYGRCGIRRTEVTMQHLADADVEANLVQVELSSRQPNLWRSELYTQALTEGDGSYDLPARMIAIQACYLTSTESGGTSVDRVLYPYSTVEYAAIPDKATEGPPVAFWYNRQITPTVTLWPVPDGEQTYTLNFRILSQIQDVSLANGLTLDMPYRFLDVFVAKLAHRLSRIYAPDKEVLRKQDAEEAWVVAAIEDQERVPLFIGGSFGAYWR